MDATGGEPFKLFKRCSLTNLDIGQEESETEPEAPAVFELEEEEEEEEQCRDGIPWQRKVPLRPQDEISVSSIISALLAKIEPKATPFTKLSWGVTAKDMHNEKQAILFAEKLYISKLTGTNCKLQEENKMFLAHELDQVGEFHLNIEESYDGYVVMSHSRMRKDSMEYRSGHHLKGIYNDQFLLICEKRKEFDHIDQVRVEKTLEARNQDDKILIAKRETKINDEGQKFKAVISIKDHEDAFLMDGGVLLLMRYLVVNHFVGDFLYYTMNLFGKVVRCVLSIKAEREKVHIFHRHFPNTVHVINTQYFNDDIQEQSETFFTPTGRMVLHYWHGYNYALHSVMKPVKLPVKYLPTLEVMWRSDNLLMRKFELQKKLNYENTLNYLKMRPEVGDFIRDYLATLLKYKPTNVLEFSIKYFYNTGREMAEQNQKEAAHERGCDANGR